MLFGVALSAGLHPEDAKAQNNGSSVTVISNSVKKKVSYT
jgi:hypothetical protein